MGRWRRKSKRGKQKNGDNGYDPNNNDNNGGSNNKSSKRTFTFIDKERIFTYLTEYKKAAEDGLSPPPPPPSKSDVTISTGGIVVSVQTKKSKEDFEAEEEVVDENEKAFASSELLSNTVNTASDSRLNEEEARTTTATNENMIDGAGDEGIPLLKEEEEEEKEETIPSKSSNADNDTIDDIHNHNPSCIWIGGHAFPPLNQSSLLSSQPTLSYLLLPATLNSKQRRVVHELCVDVGLYHESIGLDNNRQCIISIHYHGFDDVLNEGLLERPRSIPVRECSPWFYGNHDEEGCGRRYGGEGMLVVAGEEIEEEGEDNGGGEREEGEWNLSKMDLSLHFRHEGAVSSSGSVGGTSSSWVQLDHEHEEEQQASTIATTGKSLSLDTNTSNQDSDNGRTAAASFMSISNAREYVREITRMGREKIECLIDQPSMCLSDDCDNFDFVKLANQDLSDVSPMMRYDQIVVDDDHNNNTNTNNSNKPIPCMLVNTSAKMHQLSHEIQQLSPPEIGFDLEMHNPSKYGQSTCLIQISTPVKNYIIDVLADSGKVWTAVSTCLSPIFANPNIVKIGHYIGGMDVPALHRDFGVFVVNAFDTYEAASVLKLTRLGLAALCDHYGLPSSDAYKVLKSKYQNMDWRTRPLSDGMVDYACHDVHFLIHLRKFLIRDLTRGGLWMEDELGGKECLAEEERVAANALRDMLRDCERFEDGDGDGDYEDETAQNQTSHDIDPQAINDNNNHQEQDETSSENITPKTTIITAAQLRLNPTLMRVISKSQHQCLCLWKHKHEQPMRHTHHEQQQHSKSTLTTTAMNGFASHFAGASSSSSQNNKWRKRHTMLYNDLLQWRNNVAERVGTMPGIVCSTDFLVAVVRQQPTNKELLRRLVYFLPELLQQHEKKDESDSQENYVEEMLQIVTNSDLVLLGPMDDTERREEEEEEEEAAKEDATTTSGDGKYKGPASSAAINTNDIHNENATQKTTPTRTIVTDGGLMQIPCTTKFTKRQQQEHEATSSSANNKKKNNHDASSENHNKRMSFLAIKVAAVLTVGAIAMSVFVKTKK